MKQPLLLHVDGARSGITELLGSEPVTAYVHEHILASGIALLVERHTMRPWFGYPDTKFNPNNGTDLGVEAYDRQYTWFLGRGAEALHRHLELLAELEPYLRDAQRTRALLAAFVQNQIDAILRVHDVNNGRFPMIIDRDGHAIDNSGARVPADPNVRSPGDAFCAKALICAGRTEAEAQLGSDLLEQFTSAVLEDRFHMDQLNDDPDMISQGAAMLSLAAIPYLAGRGLAAPWVARVAALLQLVLSRHYHKNTGRFVEYVSRRSGTAYPIFNPGHCAEFACLALLAVRALRYSEPAACEAAHVRPILDRTIQIAPALIQRAFALGYNHTHGGVFVTVHPDTGAPINNTMPWWCLPEFLRAATAALTIVPEISPAEHEDPAAENELLKTVATAHNAYVTHYLNPELHLFPFQTRDGDTGEVIPVTPAIPEGDPLYHANLAYMDALELVAVAKERRGNTA